MKTIKSNPIKKIRPITRKSSPEDRFVKSVQLAMREFELSKMRRRMAKKYRMR